MQRAIKGQDQLAFVGAAEEFATHPGNTQSIATMMRLACEGIVPAIQQRAKEWLWKYVGVKVVDDEAGDHAASTEAAGICR